MYQTALLLVTGSLRVVSESIGHYLNSANKKVAKCLYVKIEPELCKPFSKSDSANIGRLSTLVPIVYCKASTICRNIDVRVLLTNALQAKLGNNKSLNFDVVFTNSNDDSNVNKYVELNFDNRNFDIVKLDNVDITLLENNLTSVSQYKVFKTVALGGTFDRLHNGHKVLLSEGALRATEKLIVGVSEVNMLKRKTLFELIEPVDKRISAVKNFLLEMDPSISYEVVPITDPFGPTIVEPDIDCIVVTTETKIGGEKVNIERQKKGMHELTMCVCDLVENTDHSSDEEEKLSSSTKRMHVLGTPFNNYLNPPSPDQPYHILLKGHPLSGKSFIANQFEALGMPVINCDKILNLILNKDPELRKYVIDKCPSDLNFTEGSSDIAKFIFICLKNKEVKIGFMKFVRDKIKSELQQVLNYHYKKGAPAVLINDSVLFEEELGIEIQENWATILPESEYIKNIKEHFNLSDEEATAVVESLPSNEQYVKMSNVVFCNKWSTDTTKKQVDKAWNYLASKL
ncbi:hypothetical protein JTE90_026017 [Oedothorax gibbosus]|uniref:Cytidyltransferase-like domain-containing protein n=1 Tax=Oedothorax gibbosus TaxID=931172 RepID=A0AAV6U1V4_9ARAC|nr:hypothetical protein JTE90_026017 [Oedothorax gibbosus]